MKAIAYLRVSTLEQSSEGCSFGVQTAKVVAYAKLYDITISEIITETASSKSLQRPLLEGALSKLLERKVDGLLISKLDRLSRNLSDWNVLATRYFGKNTNIHLWSVDDHIDTNSAAGRLILNVIMSVAQWEREVISERITDALRHKVEVGERVGKVPYGMDLGTDGKKLIVNASEQAGIRLILNMKKAGVSLAGIARQLDSAGFRAKNGGPWRHSSVARILKRTKGTPF
jgi:DNA invertase Pin-like site-specific DNA recombinase